MESLVHAVLSNALAATGLALLPGLLGRWGRSPALVHGLWLLVLLKLVTPPLIPAPCIGTGSSSSSSSSRLQAETPAAGPPETTMAAARSVDESLTWEEPDPKLEAELEAEVQPWPRVLDPLAPTDVDIENRTPALPAGPEPLVLPAAAPAGVSRFAMPALEPLALAVMLTGALFGWCLAASRILRLHRHLVDLEPAPGALQERVRDLSTRMGLQCAPTVWLAPGRLPPMLWALGGRARLILPAELWASLGEGQQTGMLAHELAHLRRKDHWCRWFDLVVVGLYWWHPVAWLARRGLRQAEEQCCDAWAVWADPRGARGFASALLAALEFVADAPTARVAAASAVVGGRRHVSLLKRRMRMIVQARTPRGLSWAGRVGVFGLGVLFLPLAPTWTREPDPAKPEVPPDHVSLSAADEAIPQPPRAEAVDQDRDAKHKDRDRDKDRHKDKDKDRDRDRDKADKDAARHRESGEHLERMLRELGDRLSKDLEPIAQEVARALEKAAREASEALGKEGIGSEDLRKALEEASRELREAFKKGSPLDSQAREAAEKARKDMSEAVEKAREELHQAVRERARQARERAREGLLGKPGERGDDGPAEEAAAREQAPAGELEQARREVRQMEQELRRAVRRLEALERRGPRSARDPQRRPDGPPATPDAPRGFRGPGMMGPGMMGPGMMGPGMMGPGMERRLRELEEKMDRLLKELQDIKGKQKPSDPGR